MIIINAGMPKSGTSLTIKFQRDMINLIYPLNGNAEVKSRYNGFLESIDMSDAGSLIKIHDAFGPFVIKTHSPPTDGIRFLVDSQVARISYSYRDPRDAVLSVLDHGVRSRCGLDPSGAFSNLATIPDAIKFTANSLEIYSEWVRYGHALFIRYEDLMKDKLDMLKQMTKYFQLDISDDALMLMFIDHEKNKADVWNYNKGTVNRWMTEFSYGDLKLCEKEFSAKIKEMGYECSMPISFNLSILKHTIKRFYSSLGFSGLVK